MLLFKIIWGPYFFNKKSPNCLICIVKVFTGKTAYICGIKKFTLFYLRFWLYSSPSSLISRESSVRIASPFVRDDVMTIRWCISPLNKRRLIVLQHFFLNQSLLYGKVNSFLFHLYRISFWIFKYVKIKRFWISELIKKFIFLIILYESLLKVFTNNRAPLRSWI